MQGLLYGVRPERWTPPDESNHLMVGLSRTPMRLQELDRPTPIRDDWAVARTRLTGSAAPTPRWSSWTSATTSATAR